MRVNNLVATDDQRFWFGDIGCPIPPPAAPSEEVIKLIEELEDGTIDPTLVIYRDGVLDYKDDSNLKKYFAIHFLHWSLIKAKMIDRSKDDEVPKKKKRIIPDRAMDWRPPEPMFLDDVELPDEEDR